MIAVEIFRWTDGALHIPGVQYLTILVLVVLYLAVKTGGKDGG